MKVAILSTGAFRHENESVIHRQPFSDYLTPSEEQSTYVLRSYHPLFSSTRTTTCASTLCPSCEASLSASSTTWVGRGGGGLHAYVRAVGICWVARLSRCV